MKKVLFAGLLVLAGVSVSAQNLIKNEKFATEVKTKVTNANKATAGEWFIMNNEADGVTTIAWEETGDAKYPNAMKLDNSGAEKNLSWYKAFLGQRITDGLDKGIYVLTFYSYNQQIVKSSISGNSAVPITQLHSFNDNTYSLLCSFRYF